MASGACFVSGQAGDGLENEYRADPDDEPVPEAEALVHPFADGEFDVESFDALNCSNAGSLGRQLAEMKIRGTGQVLGGEIFRWQDFDELGTGCCELFDVVASDVPVHDT